MNKTKSGLEKMEIRFMCNKMMEQKNWASLHMRQVSKQCHLICSSQVQLTGFQLISYNNNNFIAFLSCEGQHKVTYITKNIAQKTS